MALQAEILEYAGDVRRGAAGVHAFGQLANALDVRCSLVLYCWSVDVPHN